MNLPLSSSPPLERKKRDPGNEDASIPVVQFMSIVMGSIPITYSVFSFMVNLLVFSGFPSLSSTWMRPQS